MNNLNYHEQTAAVTQIRLQIVLAKLPGFCKHFFNGIANTREPRTQLKYAYDLSSFFKYIQQTKTSYQNIDIPNFPVTILDEISSFELQQYLIYIKAYRNEQGILKTNGPDGIKGKVAAIRALYKYCFKNGMIVKNTSQLIEIPKIKDKNITRLNETQVDQVLDNIENGTYLEGNRIAWNRRFKNRDYALISLLLGTGIRVSECAGIDIKDIDYSECSIQIIRKGGNQDKVFFSDEVKAALFQYQEERINLTNDTNAFFLSKNQTRLSPRCILTIVHKYTKNIKEVSPHKLRATFGTNLYVATGDIYLVADTLGHSNVDTTKKHYAEIPNTTKMNARNTLQLRKN